jgi:hypothetical protein
MIFESPDGGKTIYSRKFGESDRSFHHIDDLTRFEEQKAAVWVKLKDAVFMDDPVINDLINQIQMIMELKK